MNPDAKPKNCRLSDREWLKYVEECQRGRLFFTNGHGLFSMFNRWYQHEIIGHSSFKLRATHVGVIGDERFAYEALPGRGLTRDFAIDRYTCGCRKLMIGELRGCPTPDEIDNGFHSLLRYMRTRRNGYDWLSIVTRGLWQQNGRVICSEATRNFVDAVMRFRPEYDISFDELTLPEHFFGLVEIKFIG